MSGTAGGGGRDRRTRIEIDVSTLAVDGLTATGRQVLAETFRRELTRLVQDRGLPSATSGGVDALSGLPPLPATASPARLGTALARAVHEGLRRTADGGSAVAGPLSDPPLSGPPSAGPSSPAAGGAR